jgi:GNAT superfamily N-acetyltransferase
MAQRLRIRDATVDDAAALARIHIDSRAAAMPWLAKVHNDDETIAWMAAQVIAREHVRVATEDDVPIALAAFADGWLNQLYVRPDRQNRGVGSSLFNEVCASLRTFRFWVFQRNAAARRFYERHGARLVKLTDGKGNEEREPDALYEKGQ